MCTGFQVQRQHDSDVKATPYQWKGNTIAVQRQCDISGKAARYGSVSGLEKVALWQCLDSQCDIKSFAIRLFAGKRLFAWKQAILRKPFVVIFHDCTIQECSLADARGL